MKEKRDLLRVVRTPEGDVRIDTTGKLSGRGAYVCANVDCLQKCKKSKALARALETDISDTVFEELEKHINENR